MEIPTPKTSYIAPILTIPKGPISTAEEFTDFGEDAIVSLGQYFWSRKEKVVVNNGSKRLREGPFKHGSVPNKIIWKTASTYVKHEALETVAAMQALIGENFYSVSFINKEVEEKEKELQRSK